MSDLIHRLAQAEVNAALATLSKWVDGGERNV